MERFKDSLERSIYSLDYREIGRSMLIALKSIRFSAGKTLTENAKPKKNASKGKIEKL